eukprot:Platyproteum_vivax@DN5333_c0_g1_i1.p1
MAEEPAANTTQDVEKEEEDVEKEVLEGNWRRPDVEVKQVDVTTGEEEEVALFKERAKLFRFIKDSVEWKQRGIGDARILQNKKTSVIRFLLREDKTLKIRANHIIILHDTYCNLTPNAGSDKCWVWTSKDFAEEEPAVEQFALKFSNADIATQFKSVWEQSREDNAITLKNEDTSPKCPEKQVQELAEKLDV